MKSRAYPRKRPGDHPAYPIGRKVESDATVTAVKSWVLIVRKHDER